ncbi:MAG: phosphoribosylformylglycinamidine synthase subunit PurS [Leptospirillum sp.]
MIRNSESEPRLLKITILVRVRPGILDPQGQAVQQVLHDMGENDVREVRIGKMIEITLPESDSISERVHSWCKDFLSNPLVESFEVQNIEPLTHPSVSV